MDHEKIVFFRHEPNFLGFAIICLSERIVPFILTIKEILWKKMLSSKFGLTLTSGFRKLVMFCLDKLKSELKAVFVAKIESQ